MRNPGNYVTIDDQILFGWVFAMDLLSLVALRESLFAAYLLNNIGRVVLILKVGTINDFAVLFMFRTGKEP